MRLRSPLGSASNAQCTLVRFPAAPRGGSPRLLLLLLCLLLHCSALVHGQNTPPATTEPQPQPPATTQPATDAIPSTQDVPPDQAAATQTAPAEGEAPLQPPEAAVPTEAAVSELTIEGVQARLQQLEAASNLAELVKLEATSLYQQALEQLKLAASWESKAQEFANGRAEAPALLKRLQEQSTTRPTTQPTLDVSPEATLEDLRQFLATAEAELTAKQEQAARLEEVAKTRADRRVVIPDLRAAANTRLEEVKAELAAPTPEGTASEVMLARRMLLMSQRKALEAELRAYDEELRFYTARSEVLATQRALTKTAVETQLQRVSAWQTLVSRRRQAEVDAQKRKAYEELQQSPGPVRDIAQQNAELAQDAARIAEQIDDTAGRKQAAETLIVELETEFEFLRKNVDRADVGSVIGPRMRKQRARLAELTKYEREYRTVSTQLPEIVAQSVDMDDQVLALSDIAGRVDEVMTSLTDDENIKLDREWLRGRVRELIESRRDLYTRINKLYDTYEEDLRNLKDTLGNLLSLRKEMLSFINERVLWLRSTKPLHATDWPSDPEPILTELRLVAQGWWRDIARYWGAYALAAVVWLVLVLGRRRMIREVGKAGDRVSKVFSDSYTHTLRTLLLTLALALPGAWFILFAGWRLRSAIAWHDPVAFALADALATACIATSVGWLVLSFASQVCRPRGLVEQHFRWPTDSVKRTRAAFRGLRLIGLPLLLIVTLLESYPEPAWRDTLGRSAFLLAMLVLTAALHRLLHPGRGAIANWLRRRSDEWVHRLRYIWYLIAVLTPLALAGTAAVGYYYTAVALAERLIYTAIIAFAVLLIHQLALRWLVFVQRRLAIEQARKKRAAQLEAKTEATEAGSEAVPIEETKLDIAEIGAQTRKLVRTVASVALIAGVWLSWADMLPSLGFIWDLKLWAYKVAAVEGAEGEAVAEAVDWVTLGHLLLAVFFAVATTILARNIPGLLEITLLRRLPLDTGGRFATTAIVRYIIVVVGIVLTFGTIGVGWQKVQWLAAAVTVGLGFGLQEIFANFVSGLIILFERPIRVGDIVTVSNVSGVVTRIRIRATTITDWDRKELVIPNKEFVTGQVINWSLSDSVIRIILPVGIAYGSDTDLAEQTLLKIAREHPRVIPEPNPYVLFTGFGDSTLDFELRVYLANTDYLLLTRHQINKAIDKEFRAAGIQIAFPQRDLHIRSVEQAIPLTRAGKPQAPPPPDTKLEGGLDKP